MEVKNSRPEIHYLFKNLTIGDLFSSDIYAGYFIKIGDVISCDDLDGSDIVDSIASANIYNALSLQDNVLAHFPETSNVNYEPSYITLV